MSNVPMVHNDADKRAALIPAFLGRRQDYISAYLRQIGVSELELTGTWEEIPLPIKRVLPTTQGGFGLSGGVGVGKSFAIVALMKQKAECVVTNVMNKMIEKDDICFLESAIRRGKLLIYPYTAWINWPSVIAAQRAKLFNNHTQGEVETWINEKLLCRDGVLILDDIGAEHVTGQDWAGEVLSRAIDERMRHGSLTIWTSNLDQIGLVERYGARLFSRLHALAPALELPANLPDLRVHPRK